MRGIRALRGAAELLQAQQKELQETAQQEEPCRNLKHCGACRGEKLPSPTKQPNPCRLPIAGAILINNGVVDICGLPGKMNGF